MYRNANWKEKIKPTPLWKRYAYKIARPWLSWETKRHLSTTYLRLVLNNILPERGLPLEDRRQWVNEFRAVAGATILVQGTGTGWDVVSWASLHPKRIYAVDLFSFDEWSEIATYVDRTYGVEVLFRQAPLEDVSFLPPKSIDIIASDAVYEHCRHLHNVLSETRRLLADDGIIYAAYGPLWYCAGGDHFSGRGGLRYVYNHLLLSAGDYRKYFNAYNSPFAQNESDF